MSALSFDDDHDELRRPQAVIGSVAASRRSAPPSDEPRRDEIVASVSDDLDALAVATGWDRVEVARMIGCGSPSPDVWRSEDLAVLERSREVVDLLRRQMAAVTSRRPPTAGAREVLYLTLETLIRCDGAVDRADLVLTHVVAGGTSPPPVELVGLDRLGAARDLVLRRIRAWFGPVVLDEPPASQQGGAPRVLSEDEEQALRLVSPRHLEDRLAELRHRAG